MRATVTIKRVGIVIGVTVVGVAVALLLRTFAAAPLPAPPPATDPLPEAKPPPQMAVYALPTGIVRRNAAWAYRSGSFCGRLRAGRAAACDLSAPWAARPAVI